ncbi:MAG: hypothetical protein JKY94_17660 [Rhodobacteraceae bacterium]|nr:hypothetical protein [Paracoccaceae bacterium]
MSNRHDYGDPATAVARRIDEENMGPRRYPRELWTPPPPAKTCNVCTKNDARSGKDTCSVECEFYPEESRIKDELEQAVEALIEGDRDAQDRSDQIYNFFHSLDEYLDIRDQKKEAW